MKLSKQARREAKELFRSCVSNGVLDDNRVRQLVKKVLEVKPRGYLAILAHFQRLVKLDIERRTARVESAAPLSESLQASVQSSLIGTYGGGLSISFVQNPALLGGMRVKIGSDVYDGTVQGRLTALMDSFKTP